MGGKKPIGTNPSRGNCLSGRGRLSRHSSSYEPQQETPPEMQEFSLFSNLSTPLPWQLPLSNEGKISSSSAHISISESSTLDSRSLPTSSHSIFQITPQLHKSSLMDIDKIVETVKRIEIEVSKINQVIVSNAQDSIRFSERIATLAGRQGAIQSKVSQLDNLFGSSATLWAKSTKVLREIMRHSVNGHQESLTSSRSFDSLVASTRQPNKISEDAEEKRDSIESDSPESFNLSLRSTSVVLEKPNFDIDTTFDVQKRLEYKEVGEQLSLIAAAIDEGNRRTVDTFKVIYDDIHRMNAKLEAVYKNREQIMKKISKSPNISVTAPKQEAFVLRCDTTMYAELDKISTESLLPPKYIVSNNRSSKLADTSEESEKRKLVSESPYEVDVIKA